MCPPACTPPRLHVDAGSTDEEVMMFLGRRKAGDPIPANVITEVNPFSLEPWDSPEGMWYLYNSEDGQSCIEGSSIVKVTEIGYWGPMDDLTIFTDNVTAGRKTTREFYIGQEPFGNRTGWMMHEYHREQKACYESSILQDYKSMCRVFMQNDKRPKCCDRKSSDGEQHGSFSLHNDDAEHVESMLMRFLEYEGRSSSTDTTRGRSQASAGGEQVGALERQLALSNKSLQELNSISASELHSLSGFSMEYLEINDLYDPESASSSAENSSTMSLYSDDYFDPESLLGDIRSEGILNMKEKPPDYKFCCSASAKPGNVVIKPSQTAGFVESNNSSPVGQEYMPSYTVPPKGSSSKPPISSSPFEQPSDASASASGSCMQSHPKRTHSSSSESSSSSNGSGSKSLGRIAKFGKKYCCLAPS